MDTVKKLFKVIGVVVDNFDEIKQAFSSVMAIIDSIKDALHEDSKDVQELKTIVED